MLKKDKRHLASTVMFCEKHKIPFTIIRTNRTFMMDSKIGKRLFTDNRIRLRGLNLITTVKAYVKRNKINEEIEKRDYREKGGLVYIDTDVTRYGKSFKNLIEIDVDNAYWYAAYKLEVISKEIYKRGLELRKIERLASLGSLAKTTRKITFDGKKYKIERNYSGSEDTKHIWYAISWEVDRMMKKCMVALKKDFAFYWVDAIFFENKKKNIDIVKTIIKKHGFTCKKVSNKLCEFKDFMVFVHSMQKGKKVSWSKHLGRQFCYKVKMVKK